MRVFLIGFVVASATTLLISPSFGVGHHPTKPPASVPAPPLPAFEFRGHSIGEDINTNFPYWREGYRGIDKDSCEGGDEHGVYECDDPTIIKVLDFQMLSGIKEKVVGDVIVIWLRYSFYDGKLYGLNMAFSAMRWGDMRTMLVGKYGEPSSDVMHSVQNALGATFENFVTTWKFRDGVLKLTERYPDMETSYLEFEEPGVAEKIAASKAEIEKQKGSKAF